MSKKFDWGKIIGLYEGSSPIDSQRADDYASAEELYQAFKERFRKDLISESILIDYREALNKADPHGKDVEQPEWLKDQNVQAITDFLDSVPDQTKAINELIKHIDYVLAPKLLGEPDPEKLKKEHPATPDEATEEQAKCTFGYLDVGDFFKEASHDLTPMPSFFVKTKNVDNTDPSGQGKYELLSTRMQYECMFNDQVVFRCDKKGRLIHRNIWNEDTEDEILKDDPGFRANCIIDRIKENDRVEFELRGNEWVFRFPEKNSD